MGPTMLNIYRMFSRSFNCTSSIKQTLFAFFFLAADVCLLTYDVEDITPCGQELLVSLLALSP